MTILGSAPKRGPILAASPAFFRRLATPSKCGEPLKLVLPCRLPKGSLQPWSHQGYGYKGRDAPMGNPQLNPTGHFATRDEVHRLDVGGRSMNGRLRYSRPPAARLARRRKAPPERSRACRSSALAECGTGFSGSLRLNLTQHGETYQVQT